MGGAWEAGRKQEGHRGENRDTSGNWWGCDRNPGFPPHRESKQWEGRLGPASAFRGSPVGGAVERELVGSHLLKSRTNEAQGSLADDKKQLDLVFQCLFGSVM